MRISTSVHSHERILLTDCNAIYPFPQLSKLLEINNDATYSLPQLSYLTTFLIAQLASFSLNGQTARVRS